MCLYVFASMIAPNRVGFAKTRTCSLPKMKLTNFCFSQNLRIFQPKFMIYLHTFVSIHWYMCCSVGFIPADPSLVVMYMVAERNKWMRENETEKVCHAKNQALKTLARTNTEWKTFFPVISSLYFFWCESANVSQTAAKGMFMFYVINVCIFLLGKRSVHLVCLSTKSSYIKMYAPCTHLCTVRFFFISSSSPSLRQRSEEHRPFFAKIESIEFEWFHLLGVSFYRFIYFVEKHTSHRTRIVEKSID